MIPREWIFSHRCSWWRSMYFIVIPRVSLIVILVMYVCLSLLNQLPNYNLFTQHALFILLETPLVNCGLWSNFLYIALPFYYYSLCLLSCITIIILPLDTLNPLFTANRWDWQPHRKLEAKYLFMLCAGFTLLLDEEAHTSTTHHKFSGAIVRSVAKLASITFWSLAFSYWFDKPWFHNWGKTCYCAHHTFLLGFPMGCSYKPSPHQYAKLTMSVVQDFRFSWSSPNPMVHYKICNKTVDLPFDVFLCNY
jgi:hypothetical protein